MKKKRYREYLSISPQEKHWGILLKSAGYTKVEPGEKYPAQDHPDEYYFKWEKGRVIHERQVIMITNGEGVFESAHASFPVKAGSIVILHKDQWHRYKPDKETGWHEYWVGFDGPLADLIFSKSILKKDHPVLDIGDHEVLLNQFLKIFNLLEMRKPGFEKVAACYVPVMLAFIESFLKMKPLQGKRIESIVQKAQVVLSENFDQPVDFHHLAAELAVSYSWFRKMFKAYTGISPHQYVLKLRLQKARDILTYTSKSIKEVAFECGFESPYYFSKYFKADTNYTPSDFRDRLKHRLKG